MSWLGDRQLIGPPVGLAPQSGTVYGRREGARYEFTHVAAALTHWKASGPMAFKTCVDDDLPWSGGRHLSKDVRSANQFPSNQQVKFKERRPKIAYGRILEITATVKTRNNFWKSLPLAGLRSLRRLCP